MTKVIKNISPCTKKKGASMFYSPLLGTTILPLLLLFTFLQLTLFPPELEAQEKQIVKVAIIPHRSSLGNEQAYAAVFKALEQETGLDFKWVGSKSYDDVIEKIANNQADMGYVGAFAYVELQDKVGARLLCRTLNKNKKAFYNSMIITKKDSGIHSLQDLKGKSFSFTDPKSTSGYLFPLARLKKAGLNLQNLGKVSYLKRHANTLLAVYNSHVDAGATASTAIDKVDIDLEQINILWKSEPIYRGPWITRKNMPDELFFRIQQAMFKISSPDKASEIFSDLMTKAFVPAKDADYDNVREVIPLIQLAK